MISFHTLSRSPYMCEAYSIQNLFPAMSKGCSLSCSTCTHICFQTADSLNNTKLTFYNFPEGKKKKSPHVLQKHNSQSRWFPCTMCECFLYGGTKPNPDRGWSSPRVLDRDMDKTGLGWTAAGVPCVLCLS